MAWRQTRLASGGRCVRGEVPEVLAYPLHSSYLPPEAVHLVAQVEGRGYGELYVPAPRAARAPKEVLSVPEAIPVGAEAAPREGERAVARQRRCRCRCLGANAALVSSSLSSYLPYCAISASPPSLPDSLRINSAPLAGFGEARRISKKKKRSRHREAFESCGREQRTAEGVASVERVVVVSVRRARGVSLSVVRETRSGENLSNVVARVVHLTTDDAQGGRERRERRPDRQ